MEVTKASVSTIFPNIVPLTQIFVSLMDTISEKLTPKGSLSSLVGGTSSSPELTDALVTGLGPAIRGEMTLERSNRWARKRKRAGSDYLLVAEWLREGSIPIFFTFYVLTLPFKLKLVYYFHNEN
ncbi:hypothetical protein R3W88_000743 [Solanum pinnatisectum]|uniref:Uncharacterized protein n=1 Tax=Solanum pinnatisectum TaxID=50273 RepID=A0AAV9MGJ4_9SOLN|nr:hypothetical protein R3W88_000743 [Solanum pinnatisectum]